MEELRGFDAYEGQIILGFGIEKRKGLIVPKVKELEVPKVNKKYNNWARKLTELEPKEYKEKEFNSLDTETIIRYAAYIIDRLLGSKALDDFKEFLKTIEITNSDSVLDGVVLEIVDTRTWERFIHKTCIPNINVEAHAVSLVHEFVHYYCKVRKIENTKKRFYLEILSTFFEKFAVNKLKEIVSDDEFEKKMTSSRLDGTLWHFNESPFENKELIKIYNAAKKVGDIGTVYQIEQLAPWIKTNSGIQDMWDYRANLRDSYGLGYLYSDALLEKCLDDEQNVKTNIKKYFDGEKTIEELLKYYDIRADKFELYDKSFNRAKNILKK